MFEVSGLSEDLLGLTKVDQVGTSSATTFEAVLVFSIGASILSFFSGGNSGCFPSGVSSQRLLN